jgi:DNA-binding MarR family transcriptional regulator
MASLPDNPPASRLAEQVGKSGPFESAAQEAYLNLVRTHVALSGAFDRLFKAHGVSQPLYNILRILRGHRARAIDESQVDHGLPIQRIGEEMVTREPDMTRLVDRLEKSGLVERRRCEEDRRVVYAVVTPAGLSLLEALAGPVASLHAAQLGSMGENKLRSLSALLCEAREACGVESENAVQKPRNMKE